MLGRSRVWLAFLAEDDAGQERDYDGRVERVEHAVEEEFRDHELVGRVEFAPAKSKGSALP